MKTENSASLGLGVCPFCNSVFAALRGMSVHLKSCTHPRALLSELVEGPFPRTCRVWWAGENTWYEGLASPSRDVENCWQVTYSNGQIENEFCHVVIFDSAESVCLSPILTKRRSNRSNVLAACDISDSDISSDSSCLSARGSSITPLAAATRRISDSEISPGFPTCSPIVDSPDVPAAEVPACLSHSSGVR